MTQTIEESAPTLVDLDALAPRRPKVFAIGFHKTSTTSLANALYTLGYSVDGYFNVAGIPTGVSVEQYVIERAEQTDVVQDMPWPVFYRELDTAFPGSKFVLTVRDPDRWIRSVTTHFGRKVIPSHVAIYGVADAASHPDVYLERFRRHEAEVRTYFADRPDDLLTMDIAGGDGWPELCGFLGIEEPDFPFPSQNAATDRERGRLGRVLDRGLSRAISLAHRLTGGRVGARPGAAAAWAAIHEVDRHYEGLMQLAADLPAGDARDALLDVLVEHHRVVLKLLARATETGPGELSVAQPVEVDALLDSCRQARLQVRRWTADLTDEAVRSVVADGTTSGDQVWRSIVNAGVRDAVRATEVLAAHGVVATTRMPLTTV